MAVVFLADIRDDVTAFLDSFACKWIFDSAKENARKWKVDDDFSAMAVFQVLGMEVNISR